MAGPAAATDPPAAPPPTKARGPETGRGVVARGRTVLAPHPTEREVVGYNTDTGQPIERPVLRSFGPGKEVELPLREIAQLRTSGFLVDPDATEPRTAEGPTFTEEATRIDAGE